MTMAVSTSSSEYAMREIMEEVTINDADWRCIVVMLAETDDSQTEFITKLNKACENGYRKSVLAISRDMMLASLHQPVDVSTAPSLPSVQKLREVGDSELRGGRSSGANPEPGAPPRFLEALLIKWLIYEARLESQARRAAELERDADWDREFQAMQQPAGGDGRGKGAKSTDGRRNSARKPNSQLRRRGEEWKDIVYVDDAPLDGPDLYILLTGFRDPELPLELIKSGVPLRCVLKLQNPPRDDDCSCDDEEELRSFPDAAGISAFSALSALSLQSSRTTMKTADVENFWADFDSSLQGKLAIQPFCPPWRPDTQPNDLYDCISWTLYDIHETLQDYAAYLDSMKVRDVYEPRPERQIMAGYETFMARAPEEYSGQVPVMMEALLRQVEWNLEYEKQTHRENDDDGAASRASTSLTSLNKVNSSAAAAAFARLTEKLRLLNLKYELISRANDSEPVPQPRSELILHGDSLWLNACRANDEAEEQQQQQQQEEGNELVIRSEERLREEPGWKFAELASFQVQLPEEPRITEAWMQENEDEMKNCRSHLPGIFTCCKKEGIHRSKAKHILNILGIKRMIEAYFTDFSSSQIKKKRSLTCQGKKPTYNENESGTLDRSQDNLEQGSKRKEGIITEDKGTSSSEINSRTTQPRSIPRTAKFNVENLNGEETVYREKQQKSIIFDEFLEVLSTMENEYKRSSLKEIPKPMAIKKSKEEKFKEEKKNTQNYIRKIFSDSNSDCRCLSLGDFKTASGERPIVRSAMTPRPRPTASSLSSLSAPGPAPTLLQSFESCADLFGLINARGLLAGDERPGKSGLVAFDELTEAERLGRGPALQIVADCVLEYAAYAAWHFGPTDSILLLFCDEPEHRPGEIIERRVTCGLRTPVCFRDFCDYVVSEERDWLELRRRSSSQRSRQHEMLMSETGDGEPIFKDEDFYLPCSLKALDLERRDSERTEESVVKLEKESDAKSLKKSKKRKLSEKSVASSKKSSAQKQRASSKKQPSIKTPLPPIEEATVPPEESKHYEFFGYDLGSGGRVQVSDLTRTFEARDGVRLDLTHETWLFGTENLLVKSESTSVKVARPSDEDEGWGFWYHENWREVGVRSMCHFVMGNGIIVAFSRKSIAWEHAKANEMLYEIQISWPSGLIIKPVEYQPDADHPFYILQYYTSKGSGCKNTGNESHRKYLPNGDVVKFLNDGAIIVLRPNGTVITLVNSESDDELEALWTSAGSLTGDGNEDENGSIFSRTSCWASESALLLGRYVVLEPDGRRFEVLGGGCRVRELDRLRAHVAEEYDPEERFARREDGTDMLFRSDGQLLVTFPDGTRTLTECTIEACPASCDWSSDELDLYFAGKEPEGFVSVLCWSRAEHPDYASVARRGDSCCLTMGEAGPRLELGPRGFGELSACFGRVRLELSNSTLTLCHRACHDKCQTITSRVTFHLPDLPSPTFDPVLLTFRERANKLTVRRDESNTFILSCPEPHSKPGTCDCGIIAAGSPVGERPLRCRIFAVSRNGEAYEYHKRSVWESCEDDLYDEEEASLLVQEGEKEGLEYRLAMQPLKGSLGKSKSWRLDYKIPAAAPSPGERIGTREENEPLWDEPLVKATAGRRLPPRFLTARLLEGISRHDESENSALISMQRALARYWREVATGARKRRDNEADEARKTCECEGELESLMKEILRGRVKTIDPEIYEAGRQHLFQTKAPRDEARTRQMIDRSYRRFEGDCPWKQ